VSKHEVRRTSGTAWGSAIEYNFFTKFNTRKMSEPPNLPAMRPLDEVIYPNLNGNYTYYSDAMDMTKIKILHDEGSDLLYIIVKVHVEDGNIEMLDKILIITNNHWTVLRHILDNCGDSQKIDLINFIKYLKQFINLSINTYFYVFNYYENRELVYFFIELLTYTAYSTRSINYIYTFVGYEHNINDCNCIPLDHLLKTIEKFSPPDAKPARNRK